MSEMLASFKCNIIDYIKFFTKSCVFYFVLLLLFLFWWFLYYDTINNFLSVLTGLEINFFVREPAGD